jgi:hypothetical protein
VAVIVVIAIELVPVLREDDHQNADGGAMAVKEGLHSIEHGMQRWAAAHDSISPPQSRVTREGPGMLSGGQTIETWPANPYTGEPMAQRQAPGDFAYERGEDGKAFRLTAFGEDGKPVLAVSE